MSTKKVADMTPEEHAAHKEYQRKWYAEHKEQAAKHRLNWKKQNPEYYKNYMKKRYADMSQDEKDVRNKKASISILAKRKSDPKVRAKYNAYLKEYQQRPGIREERLKKKREKYAQKVAEKKVQCDVD